MSSEVGTLSMRGGNLYLSIEDDITGTISDVENLLSGSSVPILEGSRKIGKAYTASNHRYVRFRFFDEGTFSTSFDGMMSVVDRIRDDTKLFFT